MVAPRWPKGPLPWLIVSGMATGIAAAFFPTTRTLPIIQLSFQIGTFIFRSAIGLQVVMGAAIVAHIVESAFTVRICARNKLSGRTTLGWVGLTLLLGYGAIHELRTALKQAA